jgi:hypothetical protein
MLRCDLRNVLHWPPRAGQLTAIIIAGLVGAMRDRQVMGGVGQ